MALDLETRIVKVEERAKSNTHRLEKVEKRQEDLDKLVTAVATMGKEQEHIKADVGVIKADVKSLTEKPGKRWEGIVDKAIWAVCAAVIAFLLGRFGL